MTPHDPKAVEVLAHELTADLDVPHGRDANWYSGRLLDALTAADLSVIEVDSVPPWMERVAERAHLSGDETWWYGDEDSPIADYLPGHQKLFAIREDKP